MDPDRNDRIEKLFYAARECDPAKRAEFLARKCRDDPQLLNEVKSLLQALDEEPDFLDKARLSEIFEPETQSRPEAPGRASEPARPFERLGEFRLIERLGEGGMGVVYVALQESLDRRCALKIIRPERVGSLEAEARFGREIEAIARLRHPNIVTVFGSGDEKGVRYFAMELVEGQGLNEILHQAASKKEKIPINDVLAWIRDLARALDNAHRAGIVHRDVKPSNIRITPEGRAMLMDFGVARHTDLTALTLSGEFRGTPNYASPEQVKARRRGIDSRTDVYSLGVTLYEAVTGRVPFEGETTEQVFHQILEKDPLPPRRLNPEISRDLETVILTAMEKNPGRRYQSMAGLADDLQRVLSSEPILAKPAGWVRGATKWIRRHKFGSIASAAALIVLGTLAVLALVVSVQKEKDLREAKEAFKPIVDALGQPDFFTYTEPLGWCLTIDPRDPGASMLQAIVNISAHKLDDAAENLEECIEKSRDRNEHHLRNDAFYLLSAVKRALAEDSANLLKKKTLLGEAERAMRQAGTFDPLSSDTFLWREENPSSRAPDRSQTILEELKINENHYLVHLYLGAYLFKDLFKGGWIGKFKSAIDHFDRVLQRRPEHVSALFFQGRTHFFFARFFNFMELLDEAEAFLKHAREATGDRPSPMIDATVGQVLLLLGDNEGAYRVFEGVLDSEVGEGHHIHNALGGMGKVHARNGQYREAQEKYAQALEKSSGDGHLRVASAELYLVQGDVDRALGIAESIKEEYTRNPRQCVTSVYLLLALTYLEKNDFARALSNLHRIKIVVSPSTRDLSLSCQLLASFPDDELVGDKARALMANDLATEACFNVELGRSASPICLSAQGAAAYLLGEYSKAVALFEQAMKERRKWPPKAREYYWSDDACDRYFAAMALFKLAAESPDGETLRNKALAFFVEAEKDSHLKKPPIETLIIFERIRAKATKMLGL